MSELCFANPTIELTMGPIDFIIDGAMWVQINDRRRRHWWSGGGGVSPRFAQPGRELSWPGPWIKPRHQRWAAVEAQQRTAARALAEAQRPPGSGRVAGGDRCVESGSSGMAVGSRGGAATDGGGRRLRSSGGRQRRAAAGSGIALVRGTAARPRASHWTLAGVSIAAGLGAGAARGARWAGSGARAEAGGAATGA